jgi:putative membrane protein
VRILIKVIVNAVALGVAAWLVPGISLTTHSTLAKIGALVLVAVIFGIINAVLKPIIKVVGCGFYLLTLGLISLVVNALLFLLTGFLAEKVHIPFHVSGFWAGFWGALIVAVVGFVLHLVIPDRFDEKRRPRQDGG